MAFLEYLQDSALSDWLLISMLGFPTLIALHSVGMAIVVGLTLIVALRLNGYLTAIDATFVSRLLAIAILGFTLNLVTGLALFITRGPDYITALIFLVKMGLVALSAAIVFWLRATVKPLRDHDLGVATLQARSLSVAAVVLWFGAVVTGRLIAYLSDLYRYT